METTPVQIISLSRKAFNAQKSKPDNYLFFVYDEKVGEDGQPATKVSLYKGRHLICGGVDETNIGGADTTDVSIITGETKFLYSKNDYDYGAKVLHNYKNNYTINTILPYKSHLCKIYYEITSENSKIIGGIGISIVYMLYESSGEYTIPDNYVFFNTMDVPCVLFFLRPVANDGGEYDPNSSILFVPSRSNASAYAIQTYLMGREEVINIGNTIEGSGGLFFSVYSPDVLSVPVKKISEIVFSNIQDRYYDSIIQNNSVYAELDTVNDSVSYSYNDGVEGSDGYVRIKIRDEQDKIKSALRDVFYFYTIDVIGSVQALSEYSIGTKEENKYISNHDYFSVTPFGFIYYNSRGIIGGSITLNEFHNIFFNEDGIKEYTLKIHGKVKSIRIISGTPHDLISRSYLI